MCIRDSNYDPAGLPTGGFPYLPAVLASAAVVFLLSARGLPARDAVTADFGGILDVYKRQLLIFSLRV